MMKKILLLVFVLLAPYVSTYSQERASAFPVPKDSLPDLWVISIDMSASMKESKGGSDKFYRMVPEKVDAMVTQYYESLEKARFILLSSGMMMNELRSSSPSFAHTYGLKYVPKAFDMILIRSLSDATTYPVIRRRIEAICDSGDNFNYERSFASLARPVSMYYLIHREQIDFSKYRNIYHVEVTDDGETNDQWSIEHNFLRKHYPEHFKEVNRLLPSIACSRFDFISEKSGNFEEVTSSREQPYVYLTRYLTYEEGHPDSVQAVDSLVDVRNYHNRHFTLRMKPRSDSVHFVVIDTCRVNGHPVAVNRYLYPSDSVTVSYDKSFGNFFHNTVSINGSYQEEYTDRILGRRYRAVPFSDEMDGSFVSAETKSTESLILFMLAALLVALIALIIIRRNHVVLSIFVNGKCYRIKQKAMAQMRNDSFTILTVYCEEDVITNTHFYKGEGVSVLERDASLSESNEWGELKDNDLLIKSHRRLAPVFPDVVYDVKEDGREFIVSEISSDNDGDEIQFSYADRLSHNLIIKIARETGVKNQVAAGDNAILQLNAGMLASFISSTDAEGKYKPFNNVLVNIIHKQTLGGDYKNDYAILNIFDFNSRHTANRIFLRYCLVCFFDSAQIKEEDAAGKLVAVARFVLHSEHLKMGSVNINLDDKPGCGNVDVDISPMLSYLYLLKKGENRILYSPFADGRQPLSDGSFGLTNKTVKVFPKCTMTLLNLPFKYKHPERKIDGPNKVVYNKIYRETEVLTFLGNDRVRFLNVERDWASGIRSTCLDGSTYRAWPLTTIMDDLSKQK